MPPGMWSMVVALYDVLVRVEVEVEVEVEVDDVLVLVDLEDTAR